MSESFAGNWVLDPAGSSVEFTGKAFWGIVPVRGKFGTISGAGTVGADGSVSGQLVIDAASLDTKNQQRDKHLRSADFFNVDKHPNITLQVDSATLQGSSLACTDTLEAAGTTVPITFTAQVESADDNAVKLHAALPMSRAKFGMTWQQLPGMVKDATQGIVTARFVRE